MTTWVVDLLGVGVAVTVEADHLAGPLGRALADLTAPSGTGAAPTVAHDVRLVGPDAFGRCTLLDGPDAIASKVDTDLAAAWLLWYLNRLAATTPHRVTIHAGAVAGPYGAVVLPGPPGAGKSTMTAALVRAGCDYLSDELAALDLDGRGVHPFPRPLALHPTSVALLAAGPGGPPARTADGADAVTRPGREGGLLAPSRSLGATVARPTPPAAIVMPRIVAGAPGRLEPLPPPPALLALLAHAPEPGAARDPRLPRAGRPGRPLPRLRPGVRRPGAGRRRRHRPAPTAARRRRHRAPPGGRRPARAAVRHATLTPPPPTSARATSSSTTAARAPPTT